jgi:uroporphyrin-3 C-methyltransferase
MSSEPSDAKPVSGSPQAPEAAPAGASLLSGRVWLIALALVAVAALALSLLLWQKLSHIQEELARRSLDAGTQAVEARTLAQQSQELARDLGQRVGSMEVRLGEVALQRQQLEELMQNLSRSRDENLVVDIESALRLAQQQAQLTGSAEPLLAALRTAEQRLRRASQPRLTPLLRAIAQDVDRAKTAAFTDIPALLIKLDELTRLVDELPVANDAVAADPPPSVARAQPAKGGFLDTTTGAVQDWLGRAWAHTVAAVWQEARQLLRVSRIDRPEAALLAPEQAFFLRENTKLKLLNARMALLSRQTEVARADLQAVNQSLQRYFDKSSRKTQVATELLQQAQTQLKSTELPRLDQTLAALATVAGGR